MSFLQKPQAGVNISVDTNTASLKSSLGSKANHQDEFESDDDSVPPSPASVASDSSAGSWGKMSQVSRGPPAIRRHPEYYIDSGDVVFLVETTLFKVHSYFFVRESTKFRDILCIPSRTGTMLKASSDSYPVGLRDASAKDFARFLWIFYNPTYSYAASIPKWSSILRLSHLWSFPQIKSLAIREMDLLPISPVDKAVMAKEFQVDPERRWLETAYAALGAREEPLTKEEGRRLGLDVVLLLARVRERIRERKRKEGEEREDREAREIKEIREKERMNALPPPPTNIRDEPIGKEEEEYYIQRATAIATAQCLTNSKPNQEITPNVIADHSHQDEDFRPVSPVRSEGSYDDDDDDNENECGYDPRMAESMYLPPKPPSQPSQSCHQQRQSDHHQRHHLQGMSPSNSNSASLSGSGNRDVAGNGSGSHAGSSMHPSFASLTTPPPINPNSISQNQNQSQDQNRTHSHSHAPHNYPFPPSAMHQMQQLHQMQQMQQMAMGMKGYTEDDVAAVKEVFVS